MDEAERAWLQIRAVLVVHRWERQLRRHSPDGPTRYDWQELRRRSLATLDGVREMLDGTAAWHADVLAQLADAREEVERDA